jgi:hypothetical protein
MTQKITMGRDKRQDEIDARNAMRQSEHNAYVSGIQPRPEDSNFRSVSTAGNVPVTNPDQTTGNVELGVSATRSAQKDPDQFVTDELDRRLNMYAKAASNAGYSLNDRSITGSI